MAVYTEVSDDALRAFLAEYDIGTAVSCKGIAEGVENSNYLVRTTGGDFILTLYERRVEVRDLPYFLGLMEHLAARNVVCPRPVRGRDGQPLRRLCDRAASLTTYLPGVWPRRVGVQHCGPVGAALATMHLAARDFALTRANALGPAGWRPLLERSLGHPDIATLPAHVPGELREAVDLLLAAWPGDSLPRGHIHADLFPDNVFFLDGLLSGLIDFYFAAHDLLAYDIAVCLNAWCFEADLTFNVTKARAMLAAYQSVRPLEPAERAAMPVLCGGAALRFALTRVYDWLATPAGALVTRKDPMEYVRRLRFHRAAPGPAAYGL
jgi:homoserine kinase type II